MLMKILFVTVVFAVSSVAFANGGQVGTGGVSTRTPEQNGGVSTRYAEHLGGEGT
jgi:hypothetical protein